MKGWSERCGAHLRSARVDLAVLLDSRKRRVLPGFLQGRRVAGVSAVWMVMKMGSGAKSRLGGACLM